MRTHQKLNLSPKLVLKPRDKTEQRQNMYLKDKEKLMIEGCKEMAEESLKICNEFKYADAELDWN